MYTDNQYHTTKLTHNQSINLIKDISRRLSIALDNISWTKYYTDYLKENIKEEKARKNFKPDGIKSGLTVNEGGLFFAVRQIIEYLDGKKAPDVESYLFFRKTIYTAYSLVAQYKKEILERLDNIDYKEVLNMDYCYLASHDSKGNKLY